MNKQSHVTRVMKYITEAVNAAISGVEAGFYEYGCSECDKQEELADREHYKVPEGKDVHEYKFQNNLYDREYERNKPYSATCEHHKEELKRWANLHMSLIDSVLTLANLDYSSLDSEAK